MYSTMAAGLAANTVIVYSEHTCWANTGSS